MIIVGTAFKRVFKCEQQKIQLILSHDDPLPDDIQQQSERGELLKDKPCIFLGDKDSGKEKSLGNK